MEDAHSHLPHIGLRNLKSAFSAALCAGIYYLIDRNPTFACIGAVYGMGNDMGHSWQQGGNRLIGTIIGGFLGMGLFWCYLLLAPSGESRVLLIPLTLWAWWCSSVWPRCSAGPRRCSRAAWCCASSSSTPPRTPT
ncbi:MAG: FUSC family protein [Intestinimonas sp.]